MKNRQKKNATQNIFSNSAPGPFLLALVLVTLLMGMVGYFGVTLFLNANSDESTDSVTDDTIETASIETQQTDTVSETSARLGDLTFFTVQVSSLTDQSSAENAIDVFADEGITVNYYEVNGNYKVVAGLTLNSDYAKNMVKKLVENHPKYADSFSSELSVALGVLTYDENLTNSEALNTKLNTILSDIDELVYNGFVEGDISYDKMTETIEEMGQVTDSLIEDDDFSTALIELRDQLDQLVSRKANAEAFNKVWLNFILSH